MLALVGLVAFALEPRPALRLWYAWRLRAYVDATVRGDKAAQERVGALAGRLRELNGIALEPDFGPGGEAWHVWRAGGRTIVFEAEPTVLVPGNCGARILAFDGYGRISLGTRFAVGYRTDIHMASCGLLDGTSIPTVMIEAGTVQIYALLEREVVLIRVEDGKEAPLRNDWSVLHFRLGPPPPDRSAEAWEQALLSTDAVERLRALVFLGGTHARIPAAGETPRYPDLIALRKLADAVRARPAVQAALAELSRSPDRWLAEGAALALEPAYSRW